MSTDWESIYSGEKATDHHMECVRLRCRECGGFQEGCTCEVSESDDSAGAPCKQCGQPILEHGSEHEWEDPDEITLRESGYC